MDLPAMIHVKVGERLWRFFPAPKEGTSIDVPLIEEAKKIAEDIWGIMTENLPVTIESHGEVPASGRFIDIVAQNLWENGVCVLGGFSAS